MRAPTIAGVLSCLMLALGCAEVAIDDPPRGGAAAGGPPSTTGSMSAASGDGGAAGASEGGRDNGGAGAGGAPVAVPVCGLPDTFDSGVLDEDKWAAFPRGAFSLADGAVDLFSELAYLKLLTHPEECAFTCEIVSLSSGRVSLQIVGEEGSLIDVRAHDDAASAFRYDVVADQGELVESPVAGMPLGLAGC